MKHWTKLRSSPEISISCQYIPLVNRCILCRKSSHSLESEVALASIEKAKGSVLGFHFKLYIGQNTVSTCCGTVEEWMVPLHSQWYS